VAVDGYRKDVEDLVFRLWQAITLIGDARDDEEATEEAEFFLEQAESVLLAIVSELVHPAAQSTGQRRRTRFGRVARDSLSCRGAQWSSRRTLSPPSYPAGVVVGAAAGPRCRVRVPVFGESAGRKSIWPPHLNTGGPFRSKYTDVDGETGARVEQVGDNQTIGGSLETSGDDWPSGSERPRQLKMEGNRRLISRPGMRIGLRGRSFLLCIMAVFPALVLQTWNEYDLRVAREADVRRHVVLKTKQLGEAIDELREGARQILTAISQLNGVQDHEPVACQASLLKLKSHYPNYSVLGVADTEGQIYCTNVPTPYFLATNQPFFARALADGGLAVGNYWTEPASGQRTIHFAERFDDGAGHIGGVVFAGLDLAWLSDHLKERGLSPTASMLIADREGTIIARVPHPERFIGRNIRRSHEKIMDADEVGWEETTGVDGITRIFGYVPVALPPKDFFISVGQSRAEAFAAINVATWRGVGLILGILFAAICIAWVGACRLVGRPSPGLFQVPIDGIMAATTTVFASKLLRWSGPSRTGGRKMRYPLSSRSTSMRQFGDTSSEVGQKHTEDRTGTAPLAQPDGCGISSSSGLRVAH
jgi:hypothetical protein